MAGFPRLLFLKLSICRVVALTLAIAAAAGCEQPVRPVGNEAIVPTYNAQSGRLERISYDRNKDGRADAWLYMDGAKAIRAELDENADGTVDRWEYFRTDESAAPGPEGLPREGLARVELSARFDGKVSRWETYEDGQLAKAEEDTTGDLQPDKWESWKDGALAEVALDTKGTGKADRKILYSPDGARRMLVDTGDGTFRPVAAQP